MEIYKRLTEINKKITAIGKNKRNVQQNFQYRGVDDVMNELHGLFAEHEVIILPELINAAREDRQSKSGGALITSLSDYKFTFVTVDGSSCHAIVRGEGMDSGDKSSNKSIAVALKYALTQMFLIPTDEAKDPDADSPQPAPRKPETISKECKDFVNRINEAHDLTALNPLAELIKANTKLTANDKDYLRNLYTERKAKLK